MDPADRCIFGSKLIDLEEVPAMIVAPATQPPHAHLRDDVGSCSSCRRCEDPVLSIERRTEQQRVADQQVLAQMTAAFAASRP